MNINPSYYLTILFLLTSFSISAQYNRYWSNSFNTDASLLSGAVVGGGSGITAIYYNPAQIADISYKKFAITANIFSFYNTNFKNALVEGEKTSDLKFRVQPRFVAYLLRPEKWKNTSIEICTFTRDSYKYEQLSRSVREVDVIATYPGDEEFIGDFYYRCEYEDYWIGGGIARELSPKWKFGVSGFYSYSYIRYNYNVTTRAYNLDNKSLDLVEYNYNHYISGFTSKILFKGGLTYSGDKWQFGMAVTTPSMRITGSSTVSREVSTHNIHNQDGSRKEDLLITDQQLKLRTNFKTPFSLSLGTKRSFRKHSIYLSAEYFGGIDPFAMINQTQNQVLSSGGGYSIPSDNWLGVSSKREGITNIAFGWRGDINDHLELMGGFRTDFSFDKYDGAHDYHNPAEIITPSIDQYHFTSGVEFEFLHSDVIIGIQYSYSKDQHLEQFADFSDPIEYDPSTNTILQGYRNNSMSIWENTMSIFLGFTYNINNQGN
ncbi:hypothetical protein [Flammeovirga sp. SubArs3]|uniref:hypothetical protein n=1 Tax=Flammeovirga sp. SubArs3 TaxID=2995316 RepID=UPI00248BE8F5|nr:hypothetical protein [Flammeovirga sp. SubArs3]